MTATLSDCEPLASEPELSILDFGEIDITVLMLFGAAYSGGWHKAPVRSFGRELYGKAITIGTTQWIASRSRRQIDGEWHSGIEIQKQTNRHSAGPHVKTRFFVPYEELQRVSVQIRGVMVDRTED